MVAEVSGLAGDNDATGQLLEHATDVGLFDLHWLERVRTLITFRKTEAYGKIRARVEARARAIYATVVATS